MSKASYCITKIRNEIENNLKSNGKVDKIDKMLEAYEKIWWDFVDTHENCLDNIDGAKEREAAIQIKALT